MATDPDTVLCATRLSFRYGERWALSNVDFSVRRGEFVALIGPNGSGKTTLLRILLGLLIPDAGKVSLDGKPVLAYTPKERAKKIAYVAQEPSAFLPLTVSELVSLGRYPHSDRQQTDGADEQAVERALRLTDSIPLRDRKLMSLSGGERQKAFISRALAQSSRLLLLDEPTVHLDIHYQLQILGALKEICRTEKLAVLAVFHDLNLLPLFADRALLLKSGALRAFGKVEEVLHEKSIGEIFAVDVAAHKDTASGLTYFLPRRSKAPREEQ